MYFSRAPMPWCRDAFALEPKTLPADTPFRRHIGLLTHDKVSFSARLRDLAASPP